MRELERDDLPSPLSATSPLVVGRGRIGRSLARAAELAGRAAELAGIDARPVSSDAAA
jgi:prephenate dehydrogenase